MPQPAIAAVVKSKINPLRIATIPLRINILLSGEIGAALETESSWSAGCLQKTRPGNSAAVCGSQAPTLFDLAIRHGDGQWPGMHVTRLCSEELFPVCSPKLLQGRGALRSPRDIRHRTLLHTNGTDDRTHWLQRVGGDGVDSIDHRHGVVFNQASMALDAAVDGQGIALARTALASWDRICGRLVRPFAQALAVPYAFWIVCPKSAAELPKITVFRNWLLQEAEEDTRRIAALDSSSRATVAPRAARA